MIDKNQHLVEWIRNKAEHEFRDDVALVLLYGSYVNNTTHRLSDVDCYFIPKNDKGYGFARTFIMGDVGYDIFPMSWERVEGLAEVKEFLLPLLGNSIILHADSIEDETRFMRLRDRLRNHLSDAGFMHGKAVENFRKAEISLSRAGGNDLAVVRKQAGLMLFGLHDAIAFANQTYFTRGLKKQFEDLKKFKRIPKDYFPLYLSLVGETDPDRIRSKASELLAAVAAFLDIREYPHLPALKPAPATGIPDYAELAGFYEEAVSTFNKIYVNCDEGEHLMAFVNAVCLQHILDDDIPPMTGLEPSRLLAAYDKSDLSKLKRQTKEYETKFVRFIEAGGGVITRYDDFDAFLAANP